MINIKFITHTSNKTLDIVSLDGTTQTNISNENIQLAYDSYCIYVSPLTQEVTVSSFIVMTQNLVFSGYGLMFMLGLGALFIAFLKGSKRFYK